MKISKILCVLAVATISFNASANYALRGETPVGSKIPTVDATSPIPFNKKYVELSNEQQATFRAQYQDLTLDGRPPFPARGLRSVYQPILNKNKSLAERGRFIATISVDSKGRVDSVQVAETPSVELERYATKALARVNFEPAICAGTPCSMDFPVKLVLQ